MAEREMPMGSIRIVATLLFLYLYFFVITPRVNDSYFDIDGWGNDFIGAVVLVGCLVLFFLIDYQLMNFRSEPDIRPGFLAYFAYNVRPFVIVYVLLIVLRLLLWTSSLNGGAMAPAIVNGDKFIGSPLPYLFAAPRRGDVIYVDAGDKNRIGRVVAIGGDTFAMENGLVTVNGAPVRGRNVAIDTAFGSISPITLGEQQLAVLADRPSESLFVHTPFVSPTDIVGKIFARIWPLGHVGWL